MSKIPGKYRGYLICLGLALITLAVFLQLCSHDFIGFDDDLYITENTNVQNGLTWQGMKWALTTVQAYNWHPLTWLSHMLDCQLYKLNPAGHHLTNLLLHIINTLLMFIVFRKMTARLWPSAFIAALFALHPLHVESVAWAAERKDVLSTLFWLLTMWFYCYYVRNRRLITYLPVMICLALGLMAKQMLVTLPLVLLLMDYWPLERFSLDWKNKKADKANFFRCLIEKLPLLALSVIASIVVFLVQANVALVKSSFVIPLRYRLANVLLAYMKYIRKMFWPIDLGILYPHPETNIQWWQVLIAGLLLAYISIVAIRNFRNRRWLIVGWLWYLGTLVPVIGLVQVGLQAMADRYTYIPLTGLFIIITYFAAELITARKYKPAITITAATVILLALTALTSLQLRHWKNSFTLYEHTIAVTANNDILCYNLGVLHLQQGYVDQAIKYWDHALKIKPDQPTLHKNLATLLAQNNKFDSAIEHYRQALTFSPNDKTARERLNELLVKRERDDSADQLYERGNKFAQKNKFNDAIDCYMEALQFKPNHAPTHNNLANALFMLDRYEDALSHYVRALKNQPNLVDANYNMAVLLTKLGKTEQAIKAYQKTIEIDPTHEKAQQALQMLLNSK